MKNLLFAAALSLGTLTAFAQDDIDNTQSEATEVIATAQDGFNEITSSDVPQAVSDALAKDHPDVKISKAFVNDKGQYKLEVAKEDGTTTELYADSEGNWIDM
ncbi:hypothetical protein K8352_05625 [Flavobacteriaceae bacterium F89]|uniref:PepSY domain-containing protein n=1 Tax=Cerina litoralis TaxID=2874477 RepID=A0AAE3EU03_9FLAO|nr:hypothetical protein [Cerina litoralis]MCG2460219.1 hypothetical protein [Cerina litoralis]